MEHLDETLNEQTHSYEPPVIRTHKREDLVARALPINASTSDEVPL